MDIIKGLKAAGKGFTKGYAEAGRPETFTAAGKQVACPHCENSLFHKHTLGVKEYLPITIAQTPAAATCLVCVHCSQILWFADALEGTSQNP